MEVVLAHATIAAVFAEEARGAAAVLVRAAHQREFGDDLKLGEDADAVVLPVHFTGGEVAEAATT